MERGVKYTFKARGGNNPSIPSSYHPFYITSNLEGGYDQKSASEKNNETVYAGIDNVSLSK